MSDSVGQASYFEGLFSSDDPRRFAPIAIGIGFLIVILTVAAMSVYARDDGGAMEFLVSEGAKRRAAEQPHYSAPAAYAAQPQAGSFWSLFDRPRSAHSSAPRAAKPTAKHQVAQPAVVEVQPLGRRTMCVRLCDGYFFPIGPASDNSDVAGHESLCSNLCPGAPTRVYIAPAGSDNIEDAISTRDGKRYSALPVAFRHAGTADNTCTCRRPGQTHARLVSPYKDFTLRRGDSIMTTNGFKVFRGANAYPYKPRDFSDLSRAADVPKAKRGQLRLLERAAAFHRQRESESQIAESASPERLVKVIGKQTSITR